MDYLVNFLIEDIAHFHDVLDAWAQKKGGPCPDVPDGVSFNKLVGRVLRETMEDKVCCDAVIAHQLEFDDIGETTGWSPAVVKFVSDAYEHSVDEQLAGGEPLSCDHMRAEYANRYE